MFWQHDIFEVKGEGTCYKRVLWVAPDNRMIFLLETSDPVSSPEGMLVSEVQELLASGAWKLIEGKPPNYPMDHDISPAHLSKRDKSWAIISTMVTDHIPEIFEKMPRSRLVNIAASAHRTSVVTVKKYLRAYFHGGMTRNALLPGWSRCGAPGVTRVVVVNSPKRGRPVESGPFAGVNITVDIRRYFRLAIDIHYARERRHDLASAYYLCMRLYFLQMFTDPETGKAQLIPIEPYDKVGLPTREQFEYWAAKDNDMMDVLKRRMKERVWEMKYRKILGTAGGETWGPFSRFLIDATVLDVYLRSRGTRRYVIGRPTLYVVIDVFSRLIVGVYIGLEHPSWTAAMMALANAVQSKQAYCKSFGIDVEPHEWPAQHIPAIILGDRGEIESQKIDQILLRFNITVENAAPFRADWKAVVESRFKLLPAIFKPYVPGYVETDYRERGADDYRMEALLDVDEITKIIIQIILYYNNHHILRDFRRYAGMTEDEVPSIPIDIFNWGVANLSGTPRPPDADEFRFALMPISTAAVTPQGILFEGRYYTCEGAIRQRWFEKARKSGRFTIPISYDKRYTAAIYIHDKSAKYGFQLGTLTDPACEQAGLSGWEAHAMLMAQKNIHAARRNAEVIARAEAEADIDQTIAAAKASYVPDPSASVKSQVAAIRPARAAELAEERRASGLSFRPEAPVGTEAVGGNVIPLKQVQPVEDYALPSRRQRLGIKEDDNA